MRAPLLLGAVVAGALAGCAGPAAAERSATVRIVDDATGEPIGYPGFRDPDPGAGKGGISVSLVKGRPPVLYWSEGVSHEIEVIAEGYEAREVRLLPGEMEVRLRMAPPARVRSGTRPPPDPRPSPAPEPWRPSGSGRQ